jgi:rSAM/selenodomain-associated transferase 1
MIHENTTHLGVFAKYWQTGTVKTRLAASIGGESASELYRICVQVTLDRFADVGDQRTVSFWPADRRREFAAIATPAWHLAVQCQGDLGQRMRDFFKTTMAAGERRVVLMGTDTPNLPVANVKRAFQLLETYDVVLGPSEDGGYYLVGACAAPPPIFDEVDWSTPRVWDQTLHHLRRADVTFAVLPSWYDIDQLDDLQRLERDLLSAAADNPGLSALRRAVTESLADH